MKKLLLTITLLFSIALSAQNYTPLNYELSGTPANGIKIKTNLPYTGSSQMPTIIIEGYNYGKGKSIGIILNWYIFRGEFVSYGASSHGAYAPPIKLANENGKVVIFIDSREYYNRFQVRAYAKGLGEDKESNYQNWEATDETLSGTNTVTVPYKNELDGDVEIGGNVNIGGIGNKSLKIRHINGKNGDNADLGNLYLNYSTGKEVWVGGTKSSNLIVNGNAKVNNLISKGTSSFYSTEIDKKDWRLTLNTNDADNSFIYNYNQALKTFHNINIGGSHNFNSGLTVFGNGNVAIGISDSKGYKLAVAGNMVAEEIKVKLKANWPDYVFTKEYKLPNLIEVEKYINEKGHLENIPSANEVKENDGIELGEMNRKLLQKIEELTLYTIQQQKEIQEQNLKIVKFSKEDKKLLVIIQQLEKRIQKLEK